MQAIETKYFGPTNAHGARVKAKAQAGNITLEWDSSLNYDQNHKRAALQLASKLGWDGDWTGGWLPSGNGVWVCKDKYADAFKVLDK